MPTKSVPDANISLQTREMGGVHRGSHRAEQTFANRDTFIDIPIKKRACSGKPKPLMDF